MGFGDSMEKTSILDILENISEVWDEQSALLILENPLLFTQMEEVVRAGNLARTVKNNISKFLGEFNDPQTADFVFRNHKRLQTYLVCNPHCQPLFDGWLAVAEMTAAQELIKKCSHEVAFLYFWNGSDEDQESLYEYLCERTDLTLDELVTLYRADCLTWLKQSELLSSPNCPIDIQIHAAWTKPDIACIGLAKNPDVSNKISTILLSRHLYQSHIILKERGLV